MCIRDRDKIYNKYFENKVSIPDINRIILTSLMLGIVADFIAIRIAFEKYRYLLEKYKKGEINYSLRPNIILIYANLIGTLGDLLGLLAVIKIANREGIIITRPVR